MPVQASLCTADIILVHMGRAERTGRPGAIAALVAVVVSLCGAAALPATAQALPSSLLGLYQLPDPNDCYSNADPLAPGDSDCMPVNGLQRATSVVVSPDGRNVYSAGGQIIGLNGTSTIAQLSRSTTPGPTFGALSSLPDPADCLSMDVAGGSSPDDPACAAIAPGVSDQIYDMQLSPDGKHLYAALREANAILVFSRSTTPGPTYGALTYASCNLNGGSGSCALGQGIEGVRDIAISPDGDHVYVTGDHNYGAVAVFGRNQSSGALTFKQCIAENTNGLASGCAKTGRGIGVNNAVAISPDGETVYVGSYGASNAVAAFARETTPGPTYGELTQIPGTAGCVSQDGLDHPSGTPGACADGRGLDGVSSVKVSPDGANVYAVATVNGVENHDTLTTLTRSASGTVGALSQAGDSSACLSYDDDGPAGPNPPNDPECRSAYGLKWVAALLVAPDGRGVVTGASNFSGGGIGVFERSASGALTQLPGSDGCIDDPGYASICADAHGIVSINDMAQSPDGQSLYFGTYGSRSIGAFLRGAGVPACVPPTARSTGKAMTISLACSDVNGDAFTRSIVSGPANGTLGAIDEAAGTVVYTPKSGYNGADSFTFKATEWAGDSGTATVTIEAGVSIGALSVKRSKLKAGSKRTKIYVTLSDAASVKYTIARRLSGRRAGKRCSTKRRTGKRCVLYKNVGSFTKPAKQGQSAFRFNGRLRRKALAPGRYRITAVATTSGGLVSPARQATFKIVPR